MADAAEHFRVVRELVPQDQLVRNLAILEMVQPANDFGKITLVLVKKTATSATVEIPVTHSSRRW